MDLRFRLRANPTRRIDQRNTTQDARWRGKRVDVRGEKAQIEWLVEKGKRAGFELLAVRWRPDEGDVRMALGAVSPRADAGLPPRDVRLAPGAVMHGMRQATGRMTFGSVVFEGRLRVTGAARFREALENGIGAGKPTGSGCSR